MHASKQPGALEVMRANAARETHGCMGICSATGGLVKPEGQARRWDDFSYRHHLFGQTELNQDY